MPMTATRQTGRLAEVLEMDTAGGSPLDPALGWPAGA